MATTLDNIVFALGIPHTPWVPERVESLRKLKEQLVNRPPFYRQFESREPNWAWSDRLWSWGVDCSNTIRCHIEASGLFSVTDDTVAATKVAAVVEPSPFATHLVQLQDDARVGPEFWPTLRAMVSAVPDRVIGLESAHPRSIMAKGSWYTTTDGLIGVGYVFPVRLLEQFLYWRRSQLRGPAIRCLNEDQLIGLWTASTGQLVWHPTVTIIDHDLDIRSTYGNDAHSCRRPIRSSVRGDALPDGWGTDDVLHTGRFYGATPFLCRRWVRGVSVKQMEEM